MENDETKKKIPGPRLSGLHCNKLKTPTAEDNFCIVSDSPSTYEENAEYETTAVDYCPIHDYTDRQDEYVTLRLPIPLS